MGQTSVCSSLAGLYPVGTLSFCFANLLVAGGLAGPIFGGGIPSHYLRWLYVVGFLFRRRFQCAASLLRAAFYFIRMRW